MLEWAFAHRPTFVFSLGSMATPFQVSLIRSHIPGSEDSRSGKAALTRCDEQPIGVMELGTCKMFRRPACVTHPTAVMVPSRNRAQQADVKV